MDFPKIRVFALLLLLFALCAPHSFAASQSPGETRSETTQAGQNAPSKESVDKNAKDQASKQASAPRENARSGNNARPDAKNDDGKKGAPDKDDGKKGDANKDAAQKDEATAAQDAAENDAAAGQNAAWEAMWTGQREALSEMRQTALRLSESFSSRTDNLSRHLQPFEEEGRRLLVFANTFKGYPNAMEAVQRRIQGTIGDFNAVLDPVLKARAEAQNLLERVSKMAQSIPEDMGKSRLSQEMKDYINDINRARLRLTVVLAQYDSLAPSLSMLKNLEKVHGEIGRELPTLWKDYYLSGPIPWLGAATWQDLDQKIHFSRQAMVLRLPVEVPMNSSQWGTAILRFFIGLGFAWIFCLVLKRRLPMLAQSPAGQHIFRISLPWLCLGFAFVGSAISASGDFFRLFLALGSLCLIIGQVSFAWDVRLFKHPDMSISRSPFLRLLPLAFTAYILLYLPVTSAIVLVAWLLALLFWLFAKRKAARPDLGTLQLEPGVLETEPVIIWICLFMTVTGLSIGSMALYLAFVSFSLAFQLSIGGMALVNSINDHLPKEGAKAIVGHLVVAMAAPFVLVMAVVGVFLWVVILPGGTYLLSEYALKGVNIGETQFNIIQILLIISVFYLTRAVVSMGTSFLAKLPGQGINFDSTLITPLQTALTYVSWAIFGLFVLHSLGLELSNLAMVAGGLSVGIGFGMQTIVNNFLSGLILIFGRTLQVGDVVEVGGITGRVRKISVRATMVETYDNAIIFVPNSQFMASQLINWTSFSRSVRREIQVGVAYGSDTEKVIKLLVSIAKGHDNVLKYPVPSVNFADFAASSLDFRLRFWVKDFELGATTCSDIRLRIDKVFADENIEIAFPQLDVHLKNDQPPPEKIARPKPKPIARPRRRPPDDLAEKVALARHDARSQTD